VGEAKGRSGKRREKRKGKPMLDVLLHLGPDECQNRDWGGVGKQKKEERTAGKVFSRGNPQVKNK